MVRVGVRVLATVLGVACQSDDSVGQLAKKALYQHLKRLPKKDREKYQNQVLHLKRNGQEFLAPNLLLSDLDLGTDEELDSTFEEESNIGNDDNDDDDQEGRWLQVKVKIRGTTIPINTHGGEMSVKEMVARALLDWKRHGHATPNSNVNVTAIKMEGSEWQLDPDLEVRVDASGRETFVAVVEETPVAVVNGRRGGGNDDSSAAAAVAFATAITSNVRSVEMAADSGSLTSNEDNNNNEAPPPPPPGVLRVLGQLVMTMADLFDQLPVPLQRSVLALFRVSEGDADAIVARGLSAPSRAFLQGIVIVYDLAGRLLWMMMGTVSFMTKCALGSSIWEEMGKGILFLGSCFGGLVKTVAKFFYEPKALAISVLSFLNVFPKEKVVEILRSVFKLSEGCAMGILKYATPANALAAFFVIDVGRNTYWYCKGTVSMKEAMRNVLSNTVSNGGACLCAMGAAALVTLFPVGAVVATVLGVVFVVLGALAGGKLGRVLVESLWPPPKQEQLEQKPEPTEVPKVQPKAVEHLPGPSHDSTLVNGRGLLRSLTPMLANV